MTKEKPLGFMVKLLCDGFQSSSFLFNLRLSDLFKENWPVYG